MTPELLAAIAKVLEGFDQGIFVRNISHDTEPGWTIRLMPYLAALSTLQKAVEET